MVGGLAYAIVVKYGPRAMTTAIEVTSGIMYLDSFNDLRGAYERIKSNYGSQDAVTGSSATKVPRRCVAASTSRSVQARQERASDSRREGVSAPRELLVFMEGTFSNAATRAECAVGEE